MSRYDTNGLILCQKNYHLHYNREPAQNTQQNMVVDMKAKFTGIDDIVNGEFQGNYSPMDIAQQKNTANGQQVKGENIEQSIAPTHVMPTPKTQELMDSNDGPCCQMQIFQQRNIH